MNPQVPRLPRAFGQGIQPPRHKAINIVDDFFYFNKYDQESAGSPPANSLAQGPTTPTQSHQQS